MADAYVVLAGKLGYAESERLRKLLKRLMDKEEAEIVASLPCPVAELAQKLGKKEEKVNEMLKGLFEKGVIFMTSRGYQFARDIFQLHDATACDVRSDKAWGRELLDLWEDFLQAEWYADWAKFVQTWKMPMWRVVPARKAISKGTELLPSEDVEAILDKATRFALANCSCRRIAARCDSPVEVCLQVNRAAEYAITRGTGKELTRDEAMKIMDAAEEAGLIHSVYNSSAVTNVICNCCATAVSSIILSPSMMSSRREWPRAGSRRRWTRQPAMGVRRVWRGAHSKQWKWSKSRGKRNSRPR